MKSLILSIALLSSLGAGPATQPSATELHDLRVELDMMAMRWEPYGENYPGAAEARATISILRERLDKLEAADEAAGSGASKGPTTRPIDTELLMLKMAQIHGRAERGEKNPEMSRLQNNIAKLEAEGAKINLGEANARLKRLGDIRQQLLKTYGTRFPAVVQVTNEIADLESLVGDSK